MLLRSLCSMAVAGSLLFPSLGWGQKGGASTSNTGATRMRTIRGQIRMSDGSFAPIGIVVTLSYQEGGMAAQTQTDKAGKFAFEQVGPGLYRVQIRAPGYRDIETNDLDLYLTPVQYLNLELQPDPNYLGSRPGAGAMPLEPVPRDAREFLESGQALLEKGTDYAKSIEWFKKAIKAYPKYSEAYLMMGLAYRAQHQLDQAGAALQKCIEIDGNSAPAYTALGEIQNQQQAYAQAERTLQKAVTLTPDSAPARVELARSYWALGRWQDAEPHAAKALALAPDNASAYLIMGNISLRKRDGQAALLQFKEYLRLDPQGDMAPSVREMVGKLEKALASSSPGK